MTKYKYDERYGKQWMSISQQARNLMPTCCYCLEKKSTEVHHVRYADSKGNLLLDDVILGHDIFPLCSNCHAITHRMPNNYITYPDKKFNHNTQLCQAKLRWGYQVNLIKQELKYV